MAGSSQADATTSRILCRSCGGHNLQPILSLGTMPAANRLLRADQLDAHEPRHPLDLVFCAACSLVQITESLPPEELFRDYVYFSSYSETMLASCEALANRLTRERALDGQSLVVEVASNDGYLLQFYQRLGVPVLGVEPARNVARVARERGIRTIEEFFGADLAASLLAQGRRADVIHANNVLAHVPDVNGVVGAMATLLRDDGIAVIEVPYVRDLVDRAEFDTIYHEHLSYYSLTALHELFGRHGLVIQDVEHLAIHGGSLRLFAGRAGQPSAVVATLLDDEHRLGLNTLEYYEDLASRAATIKQRLRRLLMDLSGRGHRIAAYGAAAKGATLLNYCELGPAFIDYVVDRSSHKQGLYMPGVKLRIEPPALLAERPPHYLLILAWNLADEIMRQQAGWHAARWPLHRPNPGRPDHRGAIVIVEPTALPGVFVITPELLTDQRGAFARTYSAEEFRANGLDPQVAQCNVSFNPTRGTLRGMHYQVEPYGEVKLIRCTRGSIYDVVVDLRPESPTYCRWVGAELTADNRRSLYIPQGRRPRLSHPGRAERGLLPDLGAVPAGRQRRGALGRPGVPDHVAVRPPARGRA